LRREAAVSLAERDFHIQVPAWSPPGSEPGVRIERYLSSTVAAEKLPGGHHGLVSSTIPLRVDDGSGMAPTSLSLHVAGEAYVPTNPVVPVAISQHASGGVAFPQGVSVSPVSASDGEGAVVVGNRVVFTNEGLDTDLMVEPRPAGADISWQLRSERSPQVDALAFHLPRGDRLAPSTVVPGAIEVLQEGKPELRVLPPAAQGADGESIPASYSLAGDVMTTHVDLSGTVAFPVLVDPEVRTLKGEYGTNEDSQSWANWYPCNSVQIGKCTTNQINEPCNDNNGVEFCPLEYTNLIQTGVNPTAADGAWGEWYVSAPGLFGKSGSAGITRVDLAGVTHRGAEQSDLIAEFKEDDGVKPVYSWEGHSGASGSMPLEEKFALSGVPVAFCAEGDGGHDGGEQPLCDEEYDQARSFLIADEITDVKAQSEFNYVRVEGATVTYREDATPNKVVLYHSGYEGQWVKTAPNNWYVEAEDEGLGLSEIQLQVPFGQPPSAQESVCSWGRNGFAGCPYWVSTKDLSMSGLNKTGELKVSAVASTPAGLFASPASTAETTLRLDQTGPVIETSGSLAEAENGVIGDGNYTLNFTAEDGSSASPQSGTRSYEVKVDGQVVTSGSTACPEPKAKPAEGCYALSGAWMMNGQSYGAGTHQVEIIAKDWVGNVSTKSFYVTVNEAPYEPLGPGAVNLQSGDYRLNPTDVSIQAGDAELAVSRTYDSRKLTQGAGGPLGPQWALNVADGPADADWQSLTELHNGSLSLHLADGSVFIFTAKTFGGSEFVPPPGYQTDTLKKVSTSPVEYEITDAQGDYTRFKQPTSGGPFVPVRSAETAAGTGEGLNKVKFTFTTTEGITEPTEILGPEPTEGACSPALVRGCRALTFKYASSTTAKGESKKEWGEYKGRLTEVLFTAWERTKGEMTTIPVARYEYDSQGRLRAAFDPRLSTPLETFYGYDVEDHVTAVTPLPGQQPWLLHYGTTTSDSNPGRLLSVSRFNAEAELWNGKAEKEPRAPKLSNESPTVGSTLTVKTKVNEPATSTFRWERCNYAGEECSTILGATNETYTPVVADAGHALRVEFGETNNWGTSASTSLPSEPVSDPAPKPSAIGSQGSGAGQIGSAAGAGVTQGGNIWISDSQNNRLDKVSATGAFIEAVGEGVANGEEKLQVCTSTCRAGKQGEEGGALTLPGNLAIAPSTGDIYVDTPYYVQVFSPTGGFITRIGGPSELEYPRGSAFDSNGDIWVANTYADCTVDEFGPTGNLLHTYGECGSKLGQIAKEGEDSIAIIGQTLYIGDRGNHRIEEFSLASDTWVSEFALTDGGNPASARAMTAYGNTGDLAVLVSNQGEVGGSYAAVTIFTPAGKSLERFGDEEELYWGHCLTENPSTRVFYSCQQQGNLVTDWTPAGPTEEPQQAAPNAGTTSVATVDYNVPLSGTGKPSVTPTELTKWGQTDLPVEGTAIFPATEPQAWPATGYKQAMLYYMDSANRVTTTISPSGALATTEYTSTDNVARTLTASDRELAGQEYQHCIEKGGCSVSLEKYAARYSTENTYNTTGTELTSVLGPQHEIKPSPEGIEEQARKHIRFSYEEGAPSGGPYNLVTKTIEGAQIEGQEEAAVHTVTKGYGGQSNLGWKLHEPTSTTSNTGTQELTATTAYEASTGAVKETTTPAGKGDKAKGNPTAHITQTIYYSAGANTTYPGCGEHAEWASLPCLEKPGGQPEVSGLPNLQEVSYTYNIWQEPLTIKDTSGSTERTTTRTFDPAGRLLTTAITSNSTSDRALPTMTLEYSKTLGVAVAQSTTTEGKTTSVSGTFNSLGQPTSYTDAAGNVTKYEYEKEKADRLTQVDDGEGGPPASTQAIGYNGTTGEVETLKDSGAGTFTATRNVEGDIVRESYANGITAEYTYNSVGEPSSLEYVDTAHCTSSCSVYKDNVTPSIHGQWLSQSSTFSSEIYTHDELGRLIEVEETLPGKGCTTRLYELDEDGNRTGLTTRAPGTEGKCATEGGTKQINTYDTGDRLDETGVGYDPFGNTTSLPAVDAGGSPLTSSFYINDTLASQEQNGKKISYTPDPTGRPLETITTEGSSTSTMISHYTGAEQSPAWTINPTTGSWTRYIDGIGAGLTAIETKGAAPELQLHDLHGDVIGTAKLSETEPKTSAASETTEFGVPRTTITAKFSWLGADTLPTEQPTGIINMGARTYIPQLGRFLQADPQPGGSINAYAYTNDDPVNQADPTGEWTYNWENAETGEPAPGTPREGALPGSERPQPTNLQIQEEFDAHPVFTGVPSPGLPEEGSYEDGGGLSNFLRIHGDPATGCTAKGAPGCKNSHGGHGNPNEGSACGSRSGCGGGANHGPEVVENVCIALWWTPVGLVCGAYAAGHKLGEKIG
jgi:RHS repeat-associated protein